jgi:hypothetical protein
MLSVVICYTECRYAECRYAECYAEYTTLSTKTFSIMVNKMRHSA